MNRLSDRAATEATRSPVFLFQERIWRVTGLPYRSGDGEYGHDSEGVILGDTVSGFWEPRSDAEYLTYEELSEMEDINGVPCAYEEWSTKHVWLSRPEAEAHGEKFSYRYSNGWLVFAVPAASQLVNSIEVAESVINERDSYLYKGRYAAIKAINIMDMPMAPILISALAVDQVWGLGGLAKALFCIATLPLLFFLALLALSLFVEWLTRRETKKVNKSNEK